MIDALFDALSLLAVGLACGAAATTFIALGYVIGRFDRMEGAR